ncbi:MAG: hemolysin family protein [Pseudomonadota bacterium]|nr:hemolysin family protein [Pseudomonadota bacterium]
MWEILVILVLVALNGFFALSEMALVSSRRPRLRQLAGKKVRGAKTAVQLSQNPSTFLSTVQVGITLTGIMAGAYGGASVAEKLAPHLEQVSWIAPYAYTAALGIVVLALTLVSLILGELVPKRIALLNPEAIASAVSPLMLALSRLSAPVVWILGKLSDAVLRLLRLYGRTAPAVTEDEVKAMIEEGTQLGVFAQAEREMIEGVLRLADRTVRSIMTPRPDIVWVDINEPRKDIFEDLVSTDHSRFLVSQDDIDNVLGVVHAKDLLVQKLRGETLDIRAALEKPLIVHEGTPILKLLELFRDSHQEMAVVVDEYGGLEGLVTVTDILETIAGSMPEPGEAEKPAVVRRNDGSWLVEGSASVEEIEGVLGIAGMQEGEQDFHTMAGFVMAQLGHVPETGETFSWFGLTFEIVDMDGRRIDKVLVSRPAGGSQPEVQKS